ncbi:MAG: RNHCP domain-containing protein [Candidatus Micrarchaeota archaeon]|nr:RNHCP domain-containing protein [Candidatus Micrarchaeota archaeon]
MTKEEKNSNSLGARRFRRVVEDFKCLKCGTQVKGNGYTDHCPNCLWGLHVDVMPGDRASGCRGQLQPINVVYEDDSYVITYKCVKCRAIKNFKASSEDNVDVLANLANASAKA